uniref:Uncharacterized protein n=1 Tax=Siphoviridae sp. ctsUY14 TaxID=2825693 RepID=A0A8S5P657_9CAUD|nr:MAG TPA: hypothetical protein [Siphoviridae sp. ctsUY14]
MLLGRLPINLLLSPLLVTDRIYSATRTSILILQFHCQVIFAVQTVYSPLSIGG